jgi:FKBP-type peptidyl-prolyl cis-trans isomerase
MFVDRTVVEETYGKQPAGFRISNLNRGLGEGLQMMNPGAIYEFYIPSHLSFGDKHFVNDQGQIVVPAGSALIYRVELINIY